MLLQCPYQNDCTTSSIYTKSSWFAEWWSAASDPRVTVRSEGLCSCFSNVTGVFGVKTIDDWWLREDLSRIAGLSEFRGCTCPVNGYWSYNDWRSFSIFFLLKPDSTPSVPHYDLCQIKTRFVSIFDSFLTWEVSLYHDDVQQIHCDVILLVVKSGEIWQGWQVKALMVQSRLFWYWRMVSCFRSYPKQKREFVEIDSMLCVLSSMRCPKNPQTNQGFLWTPSKMKPSSCFFQLSFHIFIGGNVLMRSGGHGFDIMLMKCLGMHHAWPMSPVDGKFQKIVVMSPNLNQNP